MGTLRDSSPRVVDHPRSTAQQSSLAAANAVAYDSEVSEMERRVLLKGLAVLPLSAVAAGPAGGVAVPAVRRVRPGGPGWPDPAEWAKLGTRVGGRLVRVTSPVAACTPDPGSPGCTELFQHLRDPFYISDSVALTQTLGWTDAWTSQASGYAVLAQTSADVAAAVNFARRHRVRLVVKGGGHSYVGAPTPRIRCSSGPGPTCGPSSSRTGLCPGAAPAWSRPSRR
jgi:hypothetical protein